MLSGSMRIVVAVHHHQPIGTSHAVMEAAYRQTYAPLLQLLEESPHVALSLHLSGHLLEWLVDRHPEYIERLSELIARGQVEPLGGAHYEPILPAIPRRDRLGAIEIATCRFDLIPIRNLVEVQALIFQRAFQIGQPPRDLEPPHKQAATERL